MQYASEMLACEVAKACTGGECRLPPRVAQLARQGVTLSVADITGPSRIPGQPRLVQTGIALVDNIIAADNPHSRTGPLQVVSPDLPDPREVTWRAGS